MDLLADPAVIIDRPGNELGVLQIDLVLLIVAVAGKLGVARKCQLPRLFRLVLHSEAPYLIGRAKRHIVIRLCTDAAIPAAYGGIAGSVPALTLILIQILTDRLPRNRPVVAIPIVAYVKISARLIKLIEHIAQDAPLCTRFYKTVAACVIGDQRSVLGRSQIVRPWRRRVRSRDDILQVFVVKISVLHSFSFYLFRPVSFYPVQEGGYVSNHLCQSRYTIIILCQQAAVAGILQPKKMRTRNSTDPQRFSVIPARLSVWYRTFQPVLSRRFSASYDAFFILSMSYRSCCTQNVPTFPRFHPAKNHAFFCFPENVIASFSVSK